MSRGRSVLVVGALALAVLAFVLGRTTSPDRPGSGTPSAVDVGFSQDMAVHHEQAILMATLAQTRAGSAVRAVANGILNIQAQEVGAFRGWLRLWAEPAADPDPMGWMDSMDSMDSTGSTGGETMAGMDMSQASMTPASMPGMASGRQLARLTTLQGRRFDVLFLQLMIRHHQGGILMADDARRHGSLPAVRAAAGSAIAEQTEDLATMRALLRADGGKQLPAPR